MRRRAPAHRACCSFFFAKITIFFEKTIDKARIPCYNITKIREGGNPKRRKGNKMDKLKAKELAQEFTDIFKWEMLNALSIAAEQKKQYAHINFTPRSSHDFTHWHFNVQADENETQNNDYGITYTIDTVQYPQIMPLWEKDKGALEESVYNYLLQNKHWTKRK